MRVLVACECSGIVRNAFAKRGHYAMSCDLKPSENGGIHYVGSVFDVIDDNWDLLIAHPPCTYLCASGTHWSWVDGRREKTEAALEFVRRLMGAAIEKIAIENPVGQISSRIKPAWQYIQPYDFGEDASKKTGLWLKNLPGLVGTRRVPGRLVTHNGRKVERWANQTDSGQNALSPGISRAANRARTYRGIADAMASQWK